MIQFYEGPTSPEVIIVGDFPNFEEQKSGKVFTNKAGAELRRALDQAELFGFKCGYTYALLHSPEGSNPDNFCVKKAVVGKTYPFSPFRQGKYFPLEIAGSGWINLQKIVADKKPKLLIATGNVACWQLLNSGQINKYRGSVFVDTKIGVPVLATYSFGQVVKEWALRTIAIADFRKAKRFISGDYHQPVRRILIEPTLQEIKDWVAEHIWKKQHEITELSFDIETAKKQITCIGFAPNELESICIPFFDPDAVAQGKNYWSSIDDEICVWNIIRSILESPIPKLGQNFMYDIQYLRRYHISPRNCTHDTMVRSHSLFPEMRKDLGFLATIHTDEAPWKMLRNRHRDQLKAED